MNVAQVLFAVSLATIAASKNQTLHILTLLPYPYYSNQQFNPSSSDGIQISLALELAKEQINNQTAILPDYNIELIHADSGCDYVERAYEAIFRNVYNVDATANPVGIIGPSCSASSLEISSLSSRNQLSLVTIHGGGSPLLFDKTKFPYSLGIFGSAKEFIDLTVRLMHERGWKKIGILYSESQRFFYNTAHDYNTLLSVNDSGAKVVLFSSVDDIHIPLVNIITLGLRINFLFTLPNTTRQIICLASKREMVYPAYQWVVISNTFDEIAVDVNFMFNGQFYSCSKENMKANVLQRVLFLNFQLFHINQTQPSTFSQYSFKQYDNQIRNELNEYNKQNNKNVTYSAHTSYFYDSLWAWSLVLDRVTKKVPGLDLTQYRYGNSFMTNMFLDEFYGLDFDGVSGRIKFDNMSGLSPRIISVVQAINGTAVEVAYYDGTHLKTTDTLHTINDSFTDRIMTIGLTEFIIYLVVVIIELFGVIIMHILTIKYRTHQAVKASSPKISQLTFIGMYLFLLIIFIYTLRNYLLFNDDTTVILCSIMWGYILPISFTLAFGTVAVRTWRLYRIFTHYLNPGKYIADRYLLTFVFIFVSVDVLLGTIWVVIDPQQVVYATEIVTDGPESFNIIVKRCFSNNPYWTLGLIFGYRAIIHLCNLVLTFLTRKIKNQSFRTKTLRLLVYLASFVTMAGYLLYYMIITFSPLSRSAFIVHILIFHCIIILFMFLISLPPLVPILQEMFFRRFPHLVKKHQVTV